VPEPEPEPVVDTAPIAEVAELEQRTELLPEPALTQVADAAAITAADTVSDVVTATPEPEPAVEPEPVFTPSVEPSAASLLEQLSMPVAPASQASAPPVEPTPQVEATPEPGPAPDLPVEDESPVARRDPAAPSWWAPLDAADYPVADEQYPKPPAVQSTETHLPEFPAPPVGFPAPSSPAGVPIWATRSPTPSPTAAPQFVGDLSIDPTSLRPRLTVRSGTARLRVDDTALTLRTLFRKERLPWAQVNRFEQHFPTGDPGNATPGVLLAITPTGAVELPATKRTPGELRHLHALLDAYRVRALARANQ
jgi:hypothetical protein